MNVLIYALYDVLGVKLYPNLSITHHILVRQ